MLSTITVDDSGDNYALWLDPRIIREIDKPAPTRTPQPQDLCNAATFIEDVTVEDRSVVNPSEGFVKIWRIQNVGDCSWTDDYQVVFVSGYQMGAPDQVNLTELVPPGGTTDIRLDMIAPDTPGTPSATGIEESPTIPGTYQILTKDEEAYASIWDLWMPHFMGFYRTAPDFTNGIHGLPTLSSGRQLWAGYLGSPVSYGCVVLGLEEAQALFDWAELGALVVVQP